MVWYFKKQVFKLSIEAMQVWPINKWRSVIHFYWGLMLKFDRSSTQVVSVENYEIRISKSDYTHILEYLCKVSFLTTLNIYKDYFKSRHKWCKVLNTRILWPETKIALVIILSIEATASLRQEFCDQEAS